MRDAATASLAAAKRGCRSERAWADVSRAADIARAKGVMVKVHGIEIMPLSLQPARKKPAVAAKVVQKPADAAVPKQPSEAVDEASPPPLSKRKQRSAQRLVKFQEKKRAAMRAAKLRSLLWRAWAQYRPIFGGDALGYTSLREQYVYKRASTLYKAAFKSDPGTSGRTKAAWLRRATPMETEPRAKRTGSAHGSQPPSPRSAEKGAKKPRGSTRALML